MMRTKRPGRLRRWLVRPFVWALALAALAVAGAVLYLKSDAASERARAFLAARLSDALERPVAVGEVGFGLWPLSLEVYELVIPGPEPGDRPVLWLPHGRVEISLAALRESRLEVERVWLESPRVFLQFNPDGSNNLPRPRKRGGRQRFEVEIGTLLLEDGSLTIDEVEVPLALEARGVVARLEGAGEGIVLDGRASAQEVVTTLPEALPYAVSTRLRLLLAPGAVELSEGHVEGPDLRADVVGSYTWEEGRQSLHLAAEAEGDGEVLTHLGYTRGEVTGPVTFNSSFDWDGSDWRLTGIARSPSLVLDGRVVTDVEAEVVGDRESVRANLVTARYAGGGVTGLVQVGLGGGTVPVSVDLDVEDLDVVRVATGEGLDVHGVAGRVSGAVTYRFTSRAPREGYGWAELGVEASEVRGRRIPITGEVTLGIAQGVLSCQVIRLRAPRQRLSLEDLRVELASGEGGFDFDLTTEDVGRLAVLLPPSPGEPPPVWMPTAGRGVVAGSVRFGGPEGVVADVRADLEDTVTPGVVADRLHGSASLTEEALESLRVELTRNGGALLVVGRVPLGGEGWQGGGSGPLELTVDAASWPLEEAAAFLPFTLPAAGPVWGLVEIQGAGEEVYGRVSATVKPVSVAGVEAESAVVELSFSPTEVRVEEARLMWPAGETRVQGAVSLDGDGDNLALAVDAPNLRLEAEPLARFLGREVRGALSLTGSLSGTLERPRAEVRLAARQLSVGDRSLGEAEAVASWDGRRVEASGSLLGLVAFNGGGALDTSAADLSFEVAVEDLGSLVQVAARGALPPLEGAFAGLLTVRGDLRAPAVGLSVPRLEATYRGLALESLEPVSLYLDGSTLVVESFYLGSPATGDELFVAGDIGLSGEVPLDLNLQGTVAASWAELLVPQLRLTGDISTLGHIGGTASAPDFDGLAGLTGGELLVPGFPHAVEDLEAVVLLYPDQLVLDSLDARLAGGRLRAAGNLALEGLELGDYRLQATAEDLRLRFPEGWVLEGDAELSLLPAVGGRLLRGTVELDRAYYLQDISLNLFQLLSGFLRRQRLEVGWTDPLLAATQLNVVVDAREALRVRNNVADLRGDADLVVRGNLARPIPVGQVELDRGGTLVYGDTEYEAERGLLTFASLDRIDPLLDLIARTRVSNYQVTLNLSGTLDRLNATFASDPPLPDLDVLALLTTGQTLGSGGELGSVAATRNSSAEVFLYGQAASAVTSRVETLFGFDKFRIDPTASAGGSVSSARLTIGKQISRDLYVTYSRSATSNEDELVQAEWRVDPGLVLVFTVTDGQAYAMEVRWEKRF